MKPIKKPCFEGLRNKVFLIMKINSSQDIFYHSIEHVQDVMRQVVRIGVKEGCSPEELFMLKTAALLHDVGYIHSRDNHEEESIGMAQWLLPMFGYSKEMISVVCQLILATKIPHRPLSLLEQIMCDSDLDYLGRSDFFHLSNMLFKEFYGQNVISSKEEWDQMQLKFIKSHIFFTETSKNTRELKKQRHYEAILDSLSNTN